MEFGFSPRDAVFVVSRCRSVRLSFTFIYCIQTAEHVVKLLPRPGSPIILFYDPNADTEQQGESLQRGVKFTGVGKFAIFD